ncbi:hypothetical protein OAE25_00400 [Verrucomicrobiales bacterium]|nr:hypothetical protein [Schleiferiaceae bacterium]MDB4617105.1 hypothetical protein [Verrucomicrobiales bacterium]|tara:strand:- start:197 stop:2362 length:2166 start_codon:yes stop_codon:yes gene_type:complete
MAESESEKLRDAKARLAVEEKISALQGRDISQNFSEVEQIKEILYLNTKKTEFDRAILKSARDLNDQILKNISGITTINKLKTAQQRTEAKADKARALAFEVEKSLSETQITNLKTLEFIRGKELIALENVAKIQQKIDDGVMTQKQGQAQLNYYKKEARDLDAEQESILKSKLTDSAKLVLSNKELAKAGQRDADLQKKVLDVTDGAAVKTAEFLKLIPGFGNVATQVIGSIEEGIEDVLSGETSIKEFREEFSGINVLGKSVFSKFNMITVAVGAISKAILEVNKQQVLLTRNLGHSLELSKVVTSEFALTSEVLGQANSLVEQFGINVQDAFTQETLQSATELQVAVGLTAEEAGELAFLSTVSGDNFERQLESSVKSVNPLLSARKILQQVGNLSSFISLNFDNNVTALVSAASKAKELGLELSQVDKIADNLLDIESSITSEFEARIITGQDLNLNMARFYAFNNDLVGVTREIGNNQKIISTFAGTNRVAQDAIAGALGLSREEISTMIREQKVLNGMTDEAREAQRLGDIKAIENVEKLKKSFQRLFESAAIFLEPIVTALTSLTAVLSYVAEGVNAIGSVFNPGFFRNLTNLLSLAAIAAGFIMGGPVVGFSVMAGLGLLGAGAVSLGNDVYSPGYGKRTLLAPEGAIALNNDDTVLAGTNLGRNSGYSRSQFKELKAAVREGASEAVLAIDGRRLMASTQVANVIEQRQYSV